MTRESFVKCKQFCAETWCQRLRILQQVFWCRDPRRCLRHASCLCLCLLCHLVRSSWPCGRQLPSACWLLRPSPRCWPLRSSSCSLDCRAGVCWNSEPPRLGCLCDALLLRRYERDCRASTGVWMVAPPSSAGATAACGLLHQAAASVRWLLTFPFQRLSGAFWTVTSSLHLSPFLWVSSGLLLRQQLQRLCFAQQPQCVCW